MVMTSGVGLSGYFRANDDLSELSRQTRRLYDFLLPSGLVHKLLFDACLNDCVMVQRGLTLESMSPLPLYSLLSPFSDLSAFIKTSSVSPKSYILPLYLFHRHLVTRMIRRFFVPFNFHIRTKAMLRFQTLQLFDLLGKILPFRQSKKKVKISAVPAFSG